MTYDERQTELCDQVRIRLNGIARAALFAKENIGSDICHDSLIDILNYAAMAVTLNTRLRSDKV